MSEQTTTTTATTKPEIKLPGKEDLREVPKDTKEDGIVIDVSIKSWKEIITDPEKLTRFKNPDALQVIVKYDVKGFIREEKFNYDEKPTTTSMLGRYIVKYDTPTVGQKIRVDFDEDGHSSIILAK